MNTNKWSVLLLVILLVGCADADLIPKWNYPLAGDTLAIAYDRMLYGASAGIVNLPGVNTVGTDPDDWLEIVIGSEELTNPEDPDDSSSGVWRCLDAQGNLEWYRGTGTDEARSSVAIIDFYGSDGYPDIVSGTTSGWNVEAMDRFGNFLWTFPAPPELAGPYSWHSSPAVADIVPDVPGLEIVIGCNAGRDTTDVIHWGMWCFQADPSDSIDDGITSLGWADYPSPPGGTDGIHWDVLWFYPTDAPVISTPCLVDMNDDGNVDVVFGTGWLGGTFDDLGAPGGKIICLDGIDGTSLWEYSTGGSYPAVSSSPAAADFDDDGDFEIVVGAYDGGIYFIDGDEDDDGIISSDEMTVYMHWEEIVSSPAIADVDGDDRYEVIIGMTGGYLNCFEYYPETDTFALEWSVEIGEAIISSPAIAGDPDDPTPWQFFRKDVKRTGFYPHMGRILHIFVGAFSGTSGAYLFQVQGDGVIIDSAYIGQEVYASPVLADIDNDCLLDIVITGANESLLGMPGPDTVFCFGTDISIAGCEIEEFNPYITDVFTEGCSLVYATVCVYDEDSNYVRGLDISNFGFLENDIPIIPPRLELLNECPPETARVDVVLLFDFSTSMDDEVGLLYSHVPEFISALSEVDYRIGALVFNGCPLETGGICEQIRTAFTGPSACALDLIAGPDWWATDSIEFACLFDAVMEMYGWPPGTRGSGNEDQYGAIIRANEWFDFRPDAQKVFVLLTDERPIVSASCDPVWGEIPYSWEEYPPDSIIDYCLEESIIVIPVTPENGEFSYYTVYEPESRIWYSGYYELGSATGGNWFNLYSEDWSELVTAIAEEIAEDSCCYQFAWRETLFCVDSIDLQVNVFSGEIYGVDDTVYNALCPPHLSLSMPSPCGGITSCPGLGFTYTLNNPSDGEIVPASVIIIVNDDTLTADSDGMVISGTGIAYTPPTSWSHADTVTFWVDRVENENGCVSFTPPCSFLVDLVPPEVVDNVPADGETLSNPEEITVSARLFDDFSGVDTSIFSMENVYIRRALDTLEYDSLYFGDSLHFTIDGIEWLGDGNYTVCVRDLYDSPDYPYCAPNNMYQFCWDFWLISVERLVWFGDTNAHACDTAYIPLFVDSLTGSSYYSMDVWFTTDFTLLEPVDICTSEVIVPIADYQLNEIIPDSLWHIHIQWDDTVSGIDGGVVFYLMASTNCNARGGDFTSVIIDSAYFNDGYPKANWEHGFFYALWNVNPWVMEIILERVDDIYKRRTLAIGATPTGTEFFDPELDIIYPEPPPTEVDAYIKLYDPDRPAIRKLLRSIQGYHFPDIWIIKTDSDSGLFVHWNPSYLPEGVFELNGFLDMKRDTSYNWNVSEEESLVIKWYFPTFARNDLALDFGWNLISFPYLPIDHTPEEIFSTSPIMLGYNVITHSYYIPDAPEAGAGYWVFSMTDSLFPMAGIPVENYTRFIYRGWNLIGDINRPIPADSLQTEPPGMLLPGIWLFDTAIRSYQPAGDTLYPGAGFWIFSIGDGMIHLP